MKSPVKVFFLEPTDLAVRSLRVMGGDCSVGKPFACCYAKAPVGRIACVVLPAAGSGIWPAEDPNWPTACDQCGKRIKNDEANKYLDYDRLYRRADTDERMTLDQAPPGACWNATWYLPHYEGPDGRSLVVRLPNGRDWMIDSRCSNCTMPEDNVHKCWVRTGRPEDGTLDVGKNGYTCKAGAGSIKAGDYHGFLRNGHLVKA